MSAEWRKVKLREVCNIRRGSSPRPIVNFMAEAGMPWVKISDATESNSRFISKTKEFIKEEGVKNSVIVNKGDLILSNSGTAGLPKFMEITACIHDGWQVFSELNLIDKHFLYYTLINIRSSLLHNAYDSTMKNLTLDMVRDAEVLLPPIGVQESIAAKLGLLDDKIELNHQTNQTLEQVAQAIFKSWFVDFEPVKAKIAALEAGGSEDDALLAAMQAIAGSALFATDAADADAPTQLARLQAEHPEQYATLRATAELFPSAMQESELGEIPEGWGVNKIEDIIQRVAVGKRYSQKTVFESGAVPVLDQGKSGIIGYHDDEPGLRASTDDPVIVFANHTCYMRLVMHDFSAIQNVLPFKGKELNIYWLYLATFGRQSFTEYKGHWPDFVIKDVVTPSNLIANRFGDIVEILLITQFRNEQQNASLSSMRDTLLPKLLSGELSVSAATDQITQAEEVIDV